MGTQIDQDATTILSLLAGAPRSEYVAAADIATKTGLTPDRVNDAVALLVQATLAEWLQTMGTAPFDFSEAMITPRGRLEAQRTTAERAVERPQSERASSQRGAAIQLFISHASDDVDSREGWSSWSVPPYACPQRRLGALVWTGIDFQRAPIRTSSFGKRCMIRCPSSELCHTRVSDPCMCSSNSERGGEPGRT